MNTLNHAINLYAEEKQQRIEKLKIDYQLTDDLKEKQLIKLTLLDLGIIIK